MDTSSHKYFNASTFPIMAKVIRGLRLMVGWSAFEVSLILLFALWTCRDVLQFSQFLIPTGGEFSHLIQANFFWMELPRCGTCFLWNGYINGGAPSFAELSAAVLHPLVALPSLLFGVIDGSKITILASLVVGGIGQWLLGRSLGLGRWARLWGGLLGVVGGHTAGKMIDGNYTATLGHACASFILPYAVDLLYLRRRRAIVGLAVAIALVILSGSGYTQIGTAIAVIPALGLLCLKHGKQQLPAWRDYAIAGGLALLLCGVFLVPLIHFLPQVTKDSDPALRSYNRLEYAPLALVIRDAGFLRSSILSTIPSPKIR